MVTCTYCKVSFYFKAFNNCTCVVQSNSFAGLIIPTDDVAFNGCPSSFHEVIPLAFCIKTHYGSPIKTLTGLKYSINSINLLAYLIYSFTTFIVQVYSKCFTCMGGSEREKMHPITIPLERLRTIS